MKKVNWGIIGLGNVADVFAKGFQFSSNGKLLGISSKNLDKLNKFKDKFKIDKKYCFNTYEELLKCDDIDIVYIALPNSLHYEWILKCINSNKKLLVEKPATLNFKEVENIQNNIKDKNFFFAEAFMYRFHPQIIKVIELINKNEIGKIISMETYFGNDILTSLNFFGMKIRKKINKMHRLYNKDLGGGAILDLGCYTVSFSTLIASLISKFENVEVVNKKKEICVTGVDINSYAELKFDNGFSSKIGASFTKNLGRKTKIFGNKGEISIEDTWLAQTPYIILKNENTKKIEINNNKNIFSYEIDFVSKCILENKNELDYPGLKLNDTVCNMKILDNWLM
jgi:predicted dehydrogenase